MQLKVHSLYDFFLVLPRNVIILYILIIFLFTSILNNTLILN